MEKESGHLKFDSFVCGVANKMFSFTRHHIESIVEKYTVGTIVLARRVDENGCRELFLCPHEGTDPDTTQLYKDAAQLVTFFEAKGHDIVPYVVVHNAFGGRLTLWNGKDTRMLLGFLSSGDAVLIESGVVSH